MRQGGTRLYQSETRLSQGCTKVRRGCHTFLLLVDLAWLPPGWSHEVRTVNGQFCNGRELCMHWVSWCMPFARLERAILAYACGVIGEGQNKNGRTLKRLRLLHTLVLESKAARRDKKRPFDGRIQVGERFQAHIPDYRGEIPDTPRQSPRKAGRQRT